MNYKNIVSIEKGDIKALDISAREKYEWVETVLRNKSHYVLPTKTRIPLKDTDYFNVMPAVLPSENVLGLKVVTRNENRRLHNQDNIDGDILLYSYDDFLPIAILDGAYITTIRTAAVAVHTMLSLATKREKIAMVGLGNIGTEIGNILFDLMSEEELTVKLYRYKDHAERFIERFKYYSNIKFQICDTYDDLMRDSDVIFSSVTYISQDFCSPEIYKNKCLVIPVHLRGFTKCDLTFDNIITSDLESIKKFKYYNKMQNITLMDNVIGDKNITSKGGYCAGNQVIVYNLGLAIYDIYFANQIYKKLFNK